MKKTIKIILLVLGVIASIALAFYFFVQKEFFSSEEFIIFRSKEEKALKGEVIGFLPYWLISKAGLDYSDYITNLTYFSLSVDEDGSIQKFVNPGEAEPGYHALFSSKADEHLQKAKEKNLNLSISVFSADNEVIEKMLENPESSATNLLSGVEDIIQEYGFTELNLDIEYTKDATPDLRKKYARFVESVRNNLNSEIIKVLSIDVSATSFVKETNFVDPSLIAPFVDKVIIMAYDYHYRGSFVTGPVSPGEGAGTVSEFDTKTAVETALTIIPAEKTILGVPTYGYEWETIGDDPRSAVIPSTGMTISNLRAETLLAECATCSATFDEVDKENHIIYKDTETGTFHQVFYPDKKAMLYKVKQAQNYSLGGVAIWALGYEGETILKPLASYHN